jgi:hypothetical protein
MLFSTRAVQISGKIGFFGVYFVEEIKTSGAYEIRLPEDFRFTHPCNVVKNPAFQGVRYAGLQSYVGRMRSEAVDHRAMLVILALHG